MAFNGSGVFIRLYSWVNDAAANIKIRADRMDNEMNGMATALSTCITKDGQTTVTANLPMAGFRHTGAGEGAARLDYATISQTQDGKVNWVAAGGTADAITATYDIPVTALVDGQICFVRASAANATTTPTFSPNSLTARTIVKNGAQALAAGDIRAAGHELILRYNLANTRWELLNPYLTATTVTDATISTSDITTNNASTAKHGWLKKLSNVATQYMDGTGNWSTPPVTTDATLTTTDITTNNASTTKHGFLKKLSNVATEFMNGQGNWATPVALPSVSTRFDASSGTPTSVGTPINVSSYTDLGVGQIAVNFTTALSSANYKFNATADGNGSTTNKTCGVASAPTTTSISFLFTTPGVGNGDPTYATVECKDY